MLYNIYMPTYINCYLMLFTCSKCIHTENFETSCLLSSLELIPHCSLSRIDVARTTEEGDPSYEEARAP